MENRTKTFLIDHSRSSLAQLAIGMEHIARHHIGFVQHALEWAVNEHNWDDA